jgi:hypothetical protein
MAGKVREVLAGIATVSDMVAAFRDEKQCRRLLEAMIWSCGRICPECGCTDSTALAGRGVGRRARQQAGWLFSVLVRRTLRRATAGFPGPTAALTQARNHERTVGWPRVIADSSPSRP